MSSVLTLFGVMMAIFIPISMLMFVIQYTQNKRITNDQIKKLREELDDKSSEQLEKEIADLKERIIVLESIVTDRGYEVERKISNL